jgi:hypothetical protein
MNFVNFCGMNFGNRVSLWDESFSLDFFVNFEITYRLGTKRKILKLH